MLAAVHGRLDRPHLPLDDEIEAIARLAFGEDVLSRAVATAADAVRDSVHHMSIDTGKIGDLRQEGIGFRVGLLRHRRDFPFRRPNGRNFARSAT